MRRPRIHRREWPIVLPVLFALAAFTLVIYASAAWGIGLSPDSAAYIYAARTLLHDGKMLAFDGGPLKHFPPLYPLMLAGLGKAGLEPVRGARLLSAVFFGCNTALAAAIVARCTRGSILATLMAGLMILGAYQACDVHLWAWSEPPFILLAILGLFLLDRHLQTPNWRALVAASVLLGLALLTRYSGAAFLLTGAVALLALSRAHWRRRIIDAAIFSAISVVPMALWLAHNASLSDAPTDRHWVHHPMHLAQFEIGLSNLGSWFVPAGLSPGATTHRAADAPACGRAGNLAARESAHPRTKSRHDDSGPAPGIAAAFATVVVAVEPGEIHIPWIMGLFPIIYGAFLTFSLSFLDRRIEFEHRTLAPAYFAFVIFLIPMILAAIQPIPTRRMRMTVGMAVIVLACAWIAGAVGNLLPELATLRADGRGYASRQWRSSGLMAMANALPRDTVIYTNYPDALEICLGRRSQWLPFKFNPDSGIRNPDFAREVAQMNHAFATTVIVYFPSDGYVRVYLPRLDELAALQILAVPVGNRRLEVVSPRQAATLRQGGLFFMLSR